MSYELIITEKPAAAKKIAEALSEGKPKKEVYQNKIPYYKLKHSGKEIVVTCAVGHLYGLAEKEKNGWTYPVYEIEWKPTSEIRKANSYSKAYLNSIKKLAKNASEFTVATDYDIEGEVIGLNIIRYACGKKDANRMKFSTLTKEDLIEAYENKTKHLDWGQAEAGETRHKLDWYYGINTSRALTAAIKTTGRFTLMSTGRVQGPALKIIVDREKEITAFKPEPYWEIELEGEAKKRTINALHEKGKFWDKKEATKIYEKTKNEKKAKINEIEKKIFKQAPPNPFDLTSLQIEAHRALNISPKQTLAIAQELYTAGNISYPRTSSQKLPEKIGYQKILSSLKLKYKEAEELLKKKKLKPNEGKKTDPAHPAIYPTGILPKVLDPETSNIYELICRRFMATFGEEAERQTMNVKIDCAKEIFIAKGTTTIKPGWHLLYGRFTPAKEEELPAVEKGEIIDVNKITLYDKETKPPKRYTEASIIKELEKKNLGTKATRASIIDTLFQRNYVEGKPIKATTLGIKTIDTLTKYNPDILDEQMTRDFEQDMEEIREKKEKEEKVLTKAKKILDKISSAFKNKEKEIGKELTQAQQETKEEMTTIGKCQKCKKGSLRIMKGKYGNFVGCSNYPNCKAIYNLPYGLFKPAKKECEECGYPMVLSIKKGNKPQEVCINPECPKKHLTKEEEKIKRKCPKCGKTLIIKNSVYGKFLACPGYPKCKHTESFEKPKYAKKK